MYMYFRDTQSIHVVLVKFLTQYVRVYYILADCSQALTKHISRMLTKYMY